MTNKPLIRDSIATFKPCVIACSFPERNRHVCFLAQLRNTVCPHDFCDLVDESAIPDNWRRHPLNPFESEEIEWQFAVDDRTRFQFTNLPLFQPSYEHPEEDEMGLAGGMVFYYPPHEGHWVCYSTHEQSWWGLGQAWADALKLLSEGRGGDGVWQ
jgi:hypothetical protein